MLSRSLPLLVLAIAGCAPQNAEIVRGSYTAFLSLNTSPAFVDQSVRLTDLEKTWSWDCRNLPDEELRFNDPAHPREPICNANGPGVAVDDGTGTPRNVRHETWANRDAFVAVREELVPWRGEAVMTTEGDLNLTFHHRLPGGDFRFVIAVRPGFAPRQCVERDGSVRYEPIDGDWLEGWSRAVDETNYDEFGAEVHWPSAYRPPGTPRGTVFMLNSFSYQFDPNDRTRTWSLPPTMRAGYARARWGPEELFAVSTRYGLPSAYLAFDEAGQGPPLSSLFYVPLDPARFGGEDFEARVREFGPFVNMMRAAERTSNEIQAELATLYGRFTADEHRPVVPSNAWRKPDGAATGLDGWGEIDYSWIRFDQPAATIARGADLSGNFHLRFYGANSQSQFMVQGEFTVRNVKRDTWVTRDVNAEKIEENQTTLCGEQL
jgi:hypothetical protein